MPRQSFFIFKMLTNITKKLKIAVGHRVFIWSFKNMVGQFEQMLMLLINEVIANFVIVKPNKLAQYFGQL